MKLQTLRDSGFKSNYISTCDGYDEANEFQSIDQDRSEGYMESDHYHQNNPLKRATTSPSQMEQNLIDMDLNSETYEDHDASIDGDSPDRSEKKGTEKKKVLGKRKPAKIERASSFDEIEKIDKVNLKAPDRKVSRTIAFGVPKGESEKRPGSGSVPDPSPGKSPR
jgi:hypothetical protein